MGKIGLAAPIIRAALEALETHFPDHVAAFNAEADNAVDLDTPAAYVFGAANEHVAYPVVEVSILDGTLGPFALDGDQAGPSDADHTPALNVVVWLMGTTGEVPALYEQALGYVRVVVEILAAQGSLGPDADVSAGPNAIRYRIVDVIPADPADVDRELRRWRIPVAIEFTVEAVERWQPS